MNDANKNLVVRITTAAVLLPGVLLLVWAGDRATAVLVAAAAGLTAHELYAMAFDRRLDPGQVLGIAAAAFAPLACAFWPNRFAGTSLLVFGGLLFATFVCTLVAGPLADAPRRVSLVFTGAFYCGFLLSTIAALRSLRFHGMEWVLLTLVLTWANDTGAYAAGRAFGRHKLYPAVSPGKTWEGFAGGVVVTVLAAFVVRGTFFEALSLSDCLWIALPASVLGPLGDLSESMLKRAFGAKDSSALIPGHGGLLDRLDALLFTAPYVYVYATLIR